MIGVLESKERNFWAVHVTTRELIGWAYGVNAKHIEHAPDCFGKERLDVDGLPETIAQPTREQYRGMVQAAIAERFTLTFHSSERVLTVYVVLSIANEGVTTPQLVDQGSKPSWGVHRDWPSVKNIKSNDIARMLQRPVFDRPVLDRTRLSDRYTFV